MSALGERTLILHLTDPESLDTLAREGINLDVVPTVELRKVVAFALDRYFRGGRSKAPSVAALKAEFGDLLDDLEIDIEVAPEDSVEWALDDLKASYIWKETQDFNKRFATGMSDAGTLERLELINDFASELVSLSINLDSKEYRTEALEGLESGVVSFEERSQDRSRIYGMGFGLPQIDEYTRGIHPGELGVVAAGAKTGKSYYLDWVALKNWEQGKRVILFTLENSIEMTLDRIACLGAGVDSSAWQQGTLDERGVEKVKEFIEKMRDAKGTLQIVQPLPGQRNVDHIVRQAQVMEMDCLLIDQLSFLEVENERQPRHLQIRDILHRLKAMISTGRGRMPCLLAVQVSREGVKAAEKEDRLEMYHMAESAEIERTADWVFGIFRNMSEEAINEAKFQTLATRREVNRHFQLKWNIGMGVIGVDREITHELQ